MKEKIAITPRSLSRNGHPALEKLRTQGYDIFFPTPGQMPEPSQVKKFLPQCVGILAGIEPISSEVLALCPDLKVISRNGVGIDNIDMAAAQKSGVAVEIARGANSRGVAELAAALMLCGIRHVSWSDNRLKNGGWERKKGIEIMGRTLGVIGCGQIGRYLVEIAAGMGMKTMAYDPFPDTSFQGGPDFYYASLDDLIQNADVISLHCPPGEKPVIDAETIAAMKDGVYLINTARASLIDEDAVLNSLESGKLRGLATDVYDTEPPVMSPLLCHENVILTPHTGGFTQESVTRATEGAVENLLKILKK